MKAAAGYALQIRLYHLPVVTGAVRFGPLGPTPSLDSRCTFPRVLGLGSGLPRRVFPEFTRFVLTDYSERTPFLVNVRYIFLPSHLVVSRVEGHLYGSFLGVVVGLGLLPPRHQGIRYVI